MQIQEDTILPTNNPRRRRPVAAPWSERSAARTVPIGLIVAVVALLGVTLLAERLAPPRADAALAPVPARAGIKINEVMTSNRSAVRDDRGAYSDWLELVNVTSEPIDVTGWSVLDGQSRLVGFTFAQHVMQPGEVVLIYASGALQNTRGYAYHAPFKLSANGDSVVLRDENGSVVDSLDCPALLGNQSYARDEGTGAFAPTMYYTPGMHNTSANHESMARDSGTASGALVINEVMAKNASYRLSQSGVYDYVELLNQGSEPIDLAGYMLSDDESRPDKWALPSITLSPGEALLVHASGGRSGAAGEVHASFGISARGETVVLSDPSGRLIDRVTCPELDDDRAYSRMGGERFTADYPPTPGQPNSAAGIAATERAIAGRNPVGVLLNEAMASARKPNANKSGGGDWVELYNDSGAAVDLSGYGLSDDPSQPRKWQFPSGSTIAPGQYLVVSLTGADKSNVQKSAYAANFKLSYAKGETLTLSMPDGTIIDRLPMLAQRAAVSYGRLPGQSGYYYFDSPTQGAQNGGTHYAGRADSVEFSRAGGWFESGSVTVALSAGEGQAIRYTTDATEPTATSPLYDQPITITANTIVRAKAFGEDMLPSLTYTESYLFGPKHSLPVVSLVSDPAYLFDDEIGIYALGSGQQKYPFKGANFFKNWERAANVELFSNGTTILSQGMGLSLQGQYSRREKQKAFKLTARNAYGSPRFEASLFPNRPYDSYKSFLLRSSGQDTAKTRFRDAVLVTLADQTSVMYQDSAPVVVYINGEYWGHYNMRERIHKYSIGQREGWEKVDDIDIVKANSSVKQGSNDEYAEFLKWLKKNGCTTPENLARVEEMVDIDNYLDYVAVQMYIGNTDLLNVKRYRSDEGDGRWRWVLFDTDWAFVTDTDSYRRWLDKGGAGSGKKTDNTLFIQLMRNPDIKKKFLTRFGQLMSLSWSTNIVNAKIDAYAAMIEPEMALQSQKWGGSVKAWRNAVNKMKAYSKERPKKMLGYIKKELGWNNNQMREYFGDIMTELGL